MTTPQYLEFRAPTAGALAADLERRTIAGVVAPFDTYARLATGQVAAFAPGSITLGDRTKLNLDHDAKQPIGVHASSTADGGALTATFRIPEGPRGDAALLEASAGLRDGFSVGADVLRAEDRPEGLYVLAATVRHVALLSEPAYEAARVTAVRAGAPAHPITPPIIPNPNHRYQQEAATMAEATTATEAAAPPNVIDTTATEAPTLTAAGAAAELAAGAAMGGAIVRDPYPYFPGGPHSMLRDYVLSTEGNVEAGGRLALAQRMNTEPRYVAGACLALAAMAAPGLSAAAGSTTANPQLVPPGYRPDLWVPLLAYEAPVWSSLRHLPISDFTPFTIPKEVSRSGLSGKPADELAPIAVGAITTGNVTVTPEEVSGAYAFSRALAMSSNPAIDAIATNAVREEYLRDLETRALAFFTAAGNSSAVATTYADGVTFVAQMRAAMAAQRIAEHSPTNAMISPTKEYLAAVGADDAQKRPLLGWDRVPNLYGPGTQADGAAEASILGVPVLPNGAAPMPANKVLMLAGGEAVAFVLPVMNFRFEADGTNPKVITLVAYGGVAFWTRRTSGVTVATNTTPIAGDTMTIEGLDEGDPDDRRAVPELDAPKAKAAR